SCHVAFDRQRQIDDPSVVQLNRRLGPPDGRYPERAQRKDQTDELLRHVSLLPLGGTPTGCDIHFSDSEAVAVYDKYGSYTCQTAKFGKAFGSHYENNFRSRFASFSVRAFPRNCSKHPGMVTHPTDSDSGSVSSGWSDRCDRPSCRSAAQ